jgi:hypothetical protein
VSGCAIVMRAQAALKSTGTVLVFLDLDSLRRWMESHRMRSDYGLDNCTRNPVT